MRTRSRLRVTFAGKTFEVGVEFLGEEELPALTPNAPLPPVVAGPATAAPHVPAAHGGRVKSPMAGKIVSLDAAVGAPVGVGQQVVTLEAMKMNTAVSSPFAGRVAAYAVKPGDQVEEGQLLVTLE